MKKIMLIFLTAIVCGIIFAQTAKNIDYPNTEPFMYFWQKLRDYSAAGRIDLTRNYELQVKGNIAGNKIVNSDLSYAINETSPDLEELLKIFLSAVDESKLFEVIAIESLDEKIESADMKINVDAENAVFKLALKANSKKTAQKIASRFDLLMSLTARFVKGGFEEEFYKNAAISSEENEIFINGRISRVNLINYINAGFVSDEFKLKKDASCYIIVFAEPFVKKESGVIYVPKFQLLDICPERDPKLAYQETKITIKRNGKEIETAFDRIRTFENKEDARKFADKYGISDESKLLN